MKYEATASSAIAFSENGVLEDWIHMFLNGVGNNMPFSEGLKRCERRYRGPEKAALNHFVRCGGPEEDKIWKSPADAWEMHVSEIAEAIKSGIEMPPLIICTDNGELVINDGNNRHEAFSRLGIDEYWVIYWETA